MELKPIGVIKSDFTEKLGVPRQSLMVSEARAILKLHPEPNFREAFNHLESFSHIWVIFVFHQADDRAWTPTIRPPRVGAPNRVGVFASRSPHRPNPIGMSAVKLERIDLEAKGGIELELSGIDLLEGTPVLDIKPYIPYADSIQDATSGWALGEIPKYKVSFSEDSLSVLQKHEVDKPRLQRLMTQVLEWDPRSTPQREAIPMDAPDSEGKEFRFRLMSFDVHWEIRKGAIFVKSLIELGE